MRRLTWISFYFYLALAAFFGLSSFMGLDIPPQADGLMILAAIAFTFAHGSQLLGWKQIILLAGLSLCISLGMESLGVATGLVYGPYHYTNRLGPMFLGLVPFLIPLAWLMMIYPSWVIARRVSQGWWRGLRADVGTAAIGALVMTAWDLVLDPLMSNAQHWVWEKPGDFFGVPLHNFAGWWLTAFLILGSFNLLRRRLWPHLDDELKARKVDPAFARLPVYSYAMAGLSNIVDALQNGLKGPALAGFFAMLPWVYLALVEDQDFESRSSNISPDS